MGLSQGETLLPPRPVSPIYRHLWQLSGRGSSGGGEKWCNRGGGCGQCGGGLNDLEPLLWNGGHGDAVSDDELAGENLEIANSGDASDFQFP